MCGKLLRTYLLPNRTLIVQNYTKGIHIGELMDGRFRIEKQPADVDEHFTYVKLASIYGSYFEEVLEARGASFEELSQRLYGAPEEHSAAKHS